MKKIQEVINDYYLEIKVNFKKIRKKINNYKRKVRYKFKNPKTEYGKKITNYLSEVYIGFKQLIFIIKEKLEKFVNITKDYIFNSRYRRRNLIATLILLIVNVICLITFNSTLAIFKNDFEYSIFGGVIGNRLSNDTDYSLLVYIEGTNELGEANQVYRLAEKIPEKGYTYTRYECLNDSVLVYNEESLSTSVSLSQKDVCSVYFDLTNKADLMLKIMLEDKVNSNTYVEGDAFPYYGYQYSHYECVNGSTLTIDPLLHNINVSTLTQEYCSVYFKKTNDSLDINLYVEDNTGNYNLIKTIPQNITYNINEEKSVCMNKLDERVDMTVSYDGFINVDSPNATKCDIYLDIASE